MENNPYAAPRASVNDVVPEERKRPFLVWVITIFMAFGIVGGIATSLATLLGSPLGGPEAAEQLRRMGLGQLDQIWTLAVMAISAVGYVDLFRLKRRALPILIAVFLAGVLYFVIKLLVSPAYRIVFDQPPMLWSMAGAWAINLAVIGYVWRLHRKGVLR
jgi:hypothetical protein